MPNPNTSADQTDFTLHCGAKSEVTWEHSNSSVGRFSNSNKYDIRSTSLLLYHISNWNVTTGTLNLMKLRFCNFESHTTPFYHWRDKVLLQWNRAQISTSHNIELRPILMGISWDVGCIILIAIWTYLRPGIFNGILNTSVMLRYTRLDREYIFHGQGFPKWENIVSIWGDFDII